jgi:four helix bundle protein
MRFENLKIWQMSEQLVLSIYGKFATSKDYGFKDQIQRASVSVMNNIAE